MKTFTQIAKAEIKANSGLLNTFVGKIALRRNIKNAYKSQVQANEPSRKVTFIKGSYNYGSGVFEISIAVRQNLFVELAEIRKQIIANYENYHEYECFKQAQEFAYSVNLEIAKFSKI